jgi:chromosome segregation ATPase
MSMALFAEIKQLKAQVSQLQADLNELRLSIALLSTGATRHTEQLQCVDELAKSVLRDGKALKADLEAATFPPKRRGRPPKVAQ